MLGPLLESTYHRLIKGCVALAAIAGIFTLFVSGHCDSFVDRVDVDFICGSPALKSEALPIVRVWQ